MKWKYYFAKIFLSHQNYDVCFIKCHELVSIYSSPRKYLHKKLYHHKREWVYRALWSKPHNGTIKTALNDYPLCPTKVLLIVLRQT